MNTSTTWLVANWKMNGDAARVQAWGTAVDAALAVVPAAVQCVLCPPAPYLATAKAAFPHNALLKLGAQNCHAAASGAFTGETSAGMVKEFCSHVIVGHSERRAMGESDAEVLAKAQAAIAAGLMPIICIGESRAAYEAGQTTAVLSGQLAPLAALVAGSYIVAYEPIWAIGSKQTPEMGEIAAAHRHIKSVLGSATCVLYGGSVNASNLGEILGIAEVSGALIGGASLEIDSMRAMIATAANLRGK